MNCFFCALTRACKSCLHLVSRKKTYSRGINTLKRQPPNEKHQLLPYYIDEYEPKQNKIDFESAREIFMKEDDKVVVKRHFEWIVNLTECKSYIKNEDILEDKDLLFNGFKHIKRDRVDKYNLIGCKSDELYENDKLFNFWSNTFISKEVEKRDFKITGWSFLTLGRRNNFFKIQSICL